MRTMEDQSLFNFDENIFRMYDIRGKYPDEIQEKTAYALGHAFIAFLKTQSKKRRFVIGIGRDIRKSSPLLFEAFAKGIRETGNHVVDFGLITTPMLYFGVYHCGYDGGAMITASHNPNPYNGIKIVKENGIPIGGDTGIFWMRDYLKSNKKIRRAETLGTLRKRELEKKYVAWNFSIAKVKQNSLKQFKLALDAGNGIGDLFADKVFTMEVETELLCVKNNDGKTCVTRDQLDVLLSGSPTSSPTPIPSEAPTPTPEITAILSHPSFVARVSASCINCFPSPWC